MKKETLVEVIALLNTANYDSETLNQKRDEVVSSLKNEEFPNSVTCNTLEELENLISWKLSKNHTGRYGVIQGSISRTYSFMHESKTKVLEWLAENYNS